MTNPQYLIGIDLGTSNCVVAYQKIDEDSETKILPILQWDEAGTVRRDELPSFIWSLEKGAVKRGEGRLAFHNQEEIVRYKLGIGARSTSLSQPDRVISSSKSWLAHTEINPKSPILPWNSDSIVGSQRLSPFDAAALLLEHIKACWDFDVAQGNQNNSLEKQQVVITVPASFDLRSQQLTLEAAHQAGYPKTTRLLEEPLAAYYNWQDANCGEPPEDETILVCDIGGGTSDFSLLRNSKNTEVAAKRIRVSPHLLLGGDNIDQAIAKKLESLFKDDSLGSYEWAQLSHQARLIKETILASQQKSYNVTIQKKSGGSSLFGSTLSSEIKREDVLEICHSFFPPCSADTKPLSDSSLTEWGLPYAKDPAITHHLAAFLDGQKIDKVLFAGGSMSSVVLRDLVMDSIEQWQNKRPEQLKTLELSLAIAKGAVAFLKATFKGKGIIDAPFPKNLYIKVQGSNSSAKALCLLPKGHKRGLPTFIQNQDLKAYTNSTALFELMWDERDAISAGDIVEISPELNSISRLISKLDSNRKGKSRVAVSIEATVEYTGAFNLVCLGPDQQQWPLKFDLNPQKSTGKFEKSSAEGSALLAGSKEQDLILSLYGKAKPKVEVSAKQITKHLEQASGLKRKDWPISYLRSLWPDLAKGMTRKGRSLDHESSWLYLAGYTLRPGFGYPNDTEAIDDLWKVFNLGLNFPKEKATLEQWWILWRRVSGGLDIARQELIIDKFFPALKKGRATSHQQYLLAGSLEKIDAQKKIALGQALVDQISSGNKDMVEAKLWCLARLSSRVPISSGPEHVLRPKQVIKWAEQLDSISLNHRSYRQISLFYRLAGRFIDDREFDLPEAMRLRFVTKLKALGFKDDMTQPLLEKVEISQQDQADLFGEELPIGLAL